MNFKKEYLLFIRHGFIRKQLAALLIFTTGYWILVCSGYYQERILPASQSWLAFLTNLGFILLMFTYSASTIGHCQISREQAALPFFSRNRKNLSAMLATKFWFLFLINSLAASLNYWLFILLIGDYTVLDFPFFHTIYFTLLFTGLVIQAATFACSLQSLPGKGTFLPDKYAMKGFMLALLISLLATQMFEYQIQIYIDYLLEEQSTYPLMKMFCSLGGTFAFTMLISIIYLESGYRNLIKRLQK